MRGSSCDLFAAPAAASESEAIERSECAACVLTVARL